MLSDEGSLLNIRPAIAASGSTPRSEASTVKCGMQLSARINGFLRHFGWAP